MKFFILYFVFVLLLQLISAIDIHTLLSEMAIEDKCGQMTQVDLGLVLKDWSQQTDDQNLIDPTKLRIALKDYKIGSILGVPTGVSPTAKTWHTVIKAIQDVALNETRHGIPIIYGTDSIHGAFIDKAILFPQPLCWAASFNKELVEKLGAIIAKETRAIGIPWNFSPVLDIGRQPVWPRLYETFGEDVYLASEVAEAYIRGHQGTDLKNRTKAATCMKHYLGYSYPFNGRDRTVAWIPEGLLREYFLPTFESGVNAGSITVMINSADVNGIPGHANHHYITDILKGELQFTGFAVSDFEDIIRLHTRDRVAETPEEAVRIAVMAGVDMSMVPNDFSFYNHCVSLAYKDEAFRKRIDDATHRILLVKNRLGLFDDPYPHEEDIANIGTQDAENLNLDAARQSIILAKNNKNILPLLKNGSKILVTGSTGNLMNVLNSGWSFTWQGEDEQLFINAGKNDTIYNSIKRLSESEVKYVEGANFVNVTDLNSVNEAVSWSDLVVLCIGEDSYAEFIGNIDNLMLSNSQITLANEVFKHNKPVVLIYVGGRPRIISSLVEKSDAVLLAFRPGNNGGLAIADILFGNYNPNAKLPISYPSGPNGYITYDHKPLEDFDYSFGPNIPSIYDPLFPFGHGLSYTTFNYSNLVIYNRVVTPANSVNGSVVVKNTGSLEGQEVVMIYLNDEYCQISRPKKQLKRFYKINLKPNESKTVNFTLTIKDMTFINFQNQRVFEPGKFNVYVGNLKDSFELKASS